MTIPEGIAAVQEAGVSLWLDDLSRDRLTSGGLERLIAERGITGVTTNPAIFEKAITGQANAYAAAIADSARQGLDADQTVHRLTLADVQQACDVFGGVYERSDRTDGFVSLEVDPRLAHDTEATVEAARRVWADVARPNLMVKIPATREGLPAIAAVLSEGINVNVTLIFSLDRYREVLLAHRTGLTTAHAGGRDLRGIASVASFFVSRLDTSIDPALPPGALERGRFAVSNARAAYAEHQSSIQEDAWRELASAGALPQRPLWASTGTKDPLYSPVKYVVELLTHGAVNTMPEATLEAVAAWNPVERPEGHDIDLDALLRTAQIDYATKVQELETAGVSAFQAAWESLLDSVSRELHTCAGNSAVQASNQMTPEG